MELIRAVSTGLFYLVWGIVAFTLLALVMVLAIILDLTQTVIELFKKLFTRNHKHS